MGGSATVGATTTTVYNYALAPHQHSILPPPKMIIRPQNLTFTPGMLTPTSCWFGGSLVPGSTVTPVHHVTAAAYSTGVSKPRTPGSTAFHGGATTASFQSLRPPPN